MQQASSNNQASEEDDSVSQDRQEDNKDQEESRRVDDQSPETVDDPLRPFMNPQNDCLGCPPNIYEEGNQIGGFAEYNFQSPYLNNNEEANRVKSFAQKSLESIKLNSRKLDQIQAGLGKENKSQDQQLSKLLFDKSTSSSLEGYEVIQVLGKGAHGAVYRVRNKEGETKAVKLFRRSQVDLEAQKTSEKLFLNEICVLNRLQQNDMGGSIGVGEAIVTDDYFGVIIEAGIATLADFKKFLKQEDKRLTEKELLGLYRCLRTNYSAVIRIGFLHRDIKPTNIILHQFDLALELIDFSLAVYYSHKLEGEVLGNACGTPGYIAPNLLRKGTGISDIEFLDGDLFSIGVTLLELADPTYKPRQNDREGMETALLNICEFQDLSRLLRILLFQENDKWNTVNGLLKEIKERKKNQTGNSEAHDNSDANDPEALNEQSDIDSDDSDGSYYKGPGYYAHPSGFVSGLKEYREDFFKFLQMVLINPKTVEKIDMQSLEMLAFDDSFTPADLKAAGDYYSGMQDLRRAGLCYTKAQERGKTLVCYENIIKDCIKENDLVKATEFCNIIIFEFLSDKTMSYNPLIFSTLGVYFYLKGDVDKAEYMLLKGLEKFQDDCDDWEKIILLNNYGCLQSISKNQRETGTETLKQAYKLMEEVIPNISSQIMKNIMGIKIKKRPLGLNLVQPKNKTRAFELMISQIDYDFKAVEEVPIVQTLLVAFFNYCYAKAIWFSEVCESDVKQVVLTKIEKCQIEFQRQKNMIIRFAEYLEIFLYITKFQEIFDDIEEDFLNEPDLHLLKQESFSLKGKKNQICILFQNKMTSEAFQEFLKTPELLLTAIGFIMTFDNNQIPEESLNEKDLLRDKLLTMSKYTNSVQIDFSRALSIKELKKESSLNSEFFEDVCQLILPGHSWNYEYKVNLNNFKDVDTSLWLLTFLNLRVYTASAELLDEMAEDIRRFKHIESLCVSEGGNRDLDGDSLRKLGSVLRDLPLIKLTLSFNFLAGLRDSGMEELAKSIANMRTLEILEIINRWGSITASGIKYLEDAIRELKGLKQLYLYLIESPLITEESIYSLASTLAELSSLTHLTLCFNACADVSIHCLNQVHKVIKSSLNPPGYIDIRVDFS